MKTELKNKLESVESVADLRKVVCEELANIPEVAKAIEEGRSRDIDLAGLMASADITSDYVGEKSKDPVAVVNEINQRLDGHKRAFKNSLDVIRETRMHHVFLNILSL